MSEKVDSRIRLIERLKIQLNGYVYVGDRKKDGWKKELPFYAFRCPVHGIVTDYPHGYDKKLECPICREERINKRKMELGLRKEAEIPLETNLDMIETPITS